MIDMSYKILNEDVISIVISSDDNASCDIIYKIITNVFIHNKILFKASGLPENIQPLMREIKNHNNLVYFEGDRKKFIIRKYPEIHSTLNYNELKHVLNEWTSTIYERRYLYLVKPDNISKVFKILNDNSYKDTDNLCDLIEYIECMIKSAPEAPNHNTYEIFLRKEYFNQIKVLLQNNNESK